MDPVYLNPYLFMIEKPGYISEIIISGIKDMPFICLEHTALRIGSRFQLLPD